MPSFQTLPGFRDFYPEQLGRLHYVFRHWRRAAHAYGFSEYDAPVLEPLELYTTKSGEEIEGQLFSFTDKGGRAVALRPEMTPSLARMVGAKAASLKRPAKWFSIGEFFRYERQQRGRLRSFYQFNADVFGEPGPQAEIELIGLLIHSLAAFGLTEADFCIRLSDRDLWLYFLESLGFDPARAAAMLSAIDKFEKAGEAAFTGFEEKHGPVDPAVREQITAFTRLRSLAELEGALPEASSGAGDRLRERLADWKALLDGLGDMGLGAYLQVDLSVVRGLAYYTGFVFEAFDRSGRFRALAGGGRYNGLVAKLGGPALPAAGFAIGDVVLQELLASKDLFPPLISACDIYVVIGGETERRQAFADIGGLRAAGYRVEYPLRETPFGKQFKAADQAGARLALIYGGDESARGLVRLRDLTERREEDVPRERLQEAVKDFFSAGAVERSPE